MTTPETDRTRRCAYLAPRYGWKENDYFSKTTKLDDGCDWASAHPERFENMPEWISAQASSAAGWRKHCCQTCAFYAPEGKDKKV